MYEYGFIRVIQDNLNNILNFEEKGSERYLLAGIILEKIGDVLLDENGDKKEKRLALLTKEGLIEMYVTLMCGNEQEISQTFDDSIDLNKKWEELPELRFKIKYMGEERCKNCN